MPRLQASQAPRLTWIVGLVAALLLIVPLAYILFPSRGSVATRLPAASQLPATSGNTLTPGSPQAVAAAGVAAKTGLKYSGSCKASGACLAITGQTMGHNAAAIVFSTATIGGRECVGYVVQNHGAWQLINADCGLPGQVTPMVGQDATVHVSGNCANVRDSASLKGGVVTCLYKGATVHVDGGPTYADGLTWWHTLKGWIAHSFLVSP